MVGPDDTYYDLTQAVLHRKPGQTVIYTSTTQEEHWITVTSASINYYQPSYHDPFPWELRLDRLHTIIAETIALFGRFNTGWIPSKGHPGPLVDHIPKDHNAPQPSPLDLRRKIRQLHTPRPCRVP